RGGLASWNGRALTNYPELKGQFIGKLLEARDGTIWVTVADAKWWALCALRQGRTECYGRDGGPGKGGVGLFGDRAGNLWVGTDDGIWRWGPKPRTFFALPPTTNGYQSFVEADDGALLLGTSRGIRRFTEQRPDGALTPPVPGAPADARHLLQDR